MFERDKGVCALCKVDTVKMERDLSNLYADDPQAWRAKWEEMMKNGWRSNRKSGLWDADHIHAVVDGGGMSGLENFRTLCVPCHKGETKLLHKRRAAEKRAGIVQKKELKGVEAAKADAPKGLPEPTPEEIAASRRNAASQIADLFN